MVKLRMCTPFVLTIFSLASLFGQSFAAVTGTPCVLKSNTNCEECLKNVSCLWCRTTRKCIDYPGRTNLLPYALCPLAEAQWGWCGGNFESLIISMSVIIGIVAIGVITCCLCKYKKIGVKSMGEKAGGEVPQDERISDIRTKHDEMKRKYGVTENQYSRFENDDACKI